jgi:hypothetical protein
VLRPVQPRDFHPSATNVYTELSSLGAVCSLGPARPPVRFFFFFALPSLSHYLTSSPFRSTLTPFVYSHLPSCPLSSPTLSTSLRHMECLRTADDEPNSYSPPAPVRASLDVRRWCQPSRSELDRDDEDLSARTFLTFPPG